MHVFDQEWFKKHQVKLVRFANTYLGKCVFGIPNDHIVFSISPGGYSHILGVNPDKKTLTCELIAQSELVYAKRLRKYGAPVWWTLHLMDSLILDHQNLVPSFGFDTLSKNAGTSGSGSPNYDAYPSNVNWATLRAAAGNAMYSYSGYWWTILTPSTSPNWRGLTRAVAHIDTSALKRLSAIYNSYIYQYQRSVYASGHWDSYGLSWVTVNAANPGTAQASDYQNMTTTKIVSDLSRATLAANANSYLTIYLNSTGILYINRTGYTVIGGRHQGDCDNITPVWTSSDVGDYTLHWPTLYVIYDYPIVCNINDSWRDVPEIYVNINDVWRSISELKINISDVWKTGV